MKKFKSIIWLLVLCTLLQCAVLPVSATETEPSETTEPTISSGPVTVPDVEYGSASINYGCRTINGMTPLGGSDRILETAQAAFVYEANTQTVIYSFNPDTRLMPGTLTKIMTALLVIENMDLDKMIVCSTRWNKSIPSSSNVAKIKEEEELTVRDLLHMLIIKGANDAALILAHHVTSSEAAFVEMMNQRAKQMGCTDTNFTNCHGLDDGNAYTTARDMAKITFEAIKNPTFKELFSTTEYEVPPTNRTEKAREYQTGNHLMYERIITKFYDKRVKGGVPAYSDGAGAGISCIAEDDGMSLIIVLLGATRKFNDRGNADYYGNFEEIFSLLKLAFNNYRICRLLYPGQMISQFPVIGGNSQVTGQVQVAIDTVLPSNVQMKHLNLRYHMEDTGLSAPISKDQMIGTVQLWYHTSCITEAELYAANEVKLETDSGLEIKGATRDDSNITGFLIFVGVVILVILVPFTIYVLVMRLRNAMRRAKRRRRRASRRRSR